LAGLLAQRLVRRGKTELALVGDCSGRVQQALDSCVLKFDRAPTEEALAAAGAETSAALMAVGTHQAINVDAARLARQTFGIATVIAVASSREHYSLLRALGARWVPPSMAMLLALEGALEFPAAFDLLTRMQGVRIRQAKITRPSHPGWPQRVRKT
jgi:Trk K+ transport system NAD-binding subunit